MGTVPETQLCIWRHRLVRDELHRSPGSIAHAKVLKGGPQILFLVRSGARSILHNISSLRWVDDSVVVVGFPPLSSSPFFPDFFVVGTRLWVGWIIGHGTIVLVTFGTASPPTKKGDSIVLGQSIPRHKTLARKGMVHDFQRRVSRLQVSIAVGNGDGFALARVDTAPAAVAAPRVGPARQRLVNRRLFLSLYD